MMDLGQQCFGFRIVGAGLDAEDTLSRGGEHLFGGEGEPLKFHAETV